MAQTEIKLPKMGESVAEATIIKWLKNDGDSVEADEPIVEIATDKVDSEVPAPEDGILVKQMVAEGDVVKVGETIAMYSVDGDTSSNDAAPAAEPATAASAVGKSAAPVPSNGSSTPKPALVATDGGSTPRIGETGRFYSPLVRNIAQTEGISNAELESISGSGAQGRVTKKDILAYVQNRGSSPQHSPAEAPSTTKPAAAPVQQTAPVNQPGAGDEIIEMDRMRTLIADHMVMSKHTSPHVTSFVEADVTNLVNWRNRHKGEFLKREGEKLTFTPLFIMAVAQAIKEMPMINVQVGDGNIIRKKDINIGMAAALPSGNLIVPVIRNADRLNLIGLATAVNDLANRARNNKLKPDEIGDGTYTLTNVGTFGNVMGTPIINQPQVAIMATGAIRKKPAVIETEMGDMIGIRHMMFLSHSYDHRVVDGALGGQFVRRVADILESWDINMPV